MGTCTATGRKSNEKDLRDKLKTCRGSIKVKLGRKDKNVFWYENVQKFGELLQLALVIIGDELQKEDYLDILGIYDTILYVVGTKEQKNATLEKKTVLNDAIGLRIDNVKKSLYEKYKNKIAFLDVKKKVKLYQKLLKIMTKKVLKMVNVNEDEKADCIVGFNSLSLNLMRFDWIIDRLSNDNTLSIADRIERRESILELLAKFDEVLDVQDVDMLIKFVEDFSAVIDEYHIKYQDIVVVKKFG